jgi:hypothetical protein
MSSSSPASGTGKLQGFAGSDLTEIGVADARFRKVALPGGSAGCVELGLPVGIYQVSFRDGTSWSSASPVASPQPDWGGSSGRDYRGLRRPDQPSGPGGRQAARGTVVRPAAASRSGILAAPD